jgi:ABC-2 type transport system permease protein
MTTATLPLPTDTLATRAVRDDVVALRTMLRSEWIKLTSVRANTAILSLTAVAGGFVAWAVATLVTDEVLTVSEVFIYSTFLTAVFAAVAGILLFSSEAQHGTLAAALTAQPTRWVIVVAKTTTAAAFGLVLGAVGMLTSLGGAALGGLAMGATSTMAATTAWSLLYTTLAAVLGTGVGMIVRHSAGAISGLLVWGLVVENLLALFMPATVFRFMPFYAGNGLLGIDADTATPESIAVALTRLQDALVFGGYTAVALVIGTVLLYRRDTN